MNNMNNFADLLGIMLYPDRILTGTDYLGVHIAESSPYFRGWEPGTTNFLIDLSSSGDRDLQREDIASRWHPSPTHIPQLEGFKYLVDITRMSKGQINRMERRLEILNGVYTRRIRFTESKKQENSQTS